MSCLPPLERNRCKKHYRLRCDPALHTHAVSTVPQGSPVSPGLPPVQRPRSGHTRSPGTEALSAGPVETAWVCAQVSGLPPELSLAPVSFERRPGESFPQTEGGSPRGPAGNASGPGRLDQAAHSTCPPRADPARTDGSGSSTSPQPSWPATVTEIAALIEKETSHAIFQTPGTRRPPARRRRRGRRPAHTDRSPAEPEGDGHADSRA